MLKNLKLISSNIVINFSLFTLLVVGIQNSSQSKKVNFIFSETISLPISFITGTSFITGSLCGAFLAFHLKNKEK
tara:strand:- start:286 stop:510 length:225 start_codon:yes stop_codon:yes gene_type:complete